MWTREELKNKAKPAFKANYWKAVLAALVLTVVVGGLSFTVSRPLPATTTSPQTAATAQTSHTSNRETLDLGSGSITFYDNGEVYSNLDDFDDEDLFAMLDEPAYNSTTTSTPSGFGLVLTGFALMLAILAAAALFIALYFFLISPLEVGANRFFVRNLNQRAQVKELAYAYDNNYRETVKTIFFRNLFIFLWSLLLIVPGIYKAYQYRMIPYLLAEDATMTREQAFAESRRMMDGHKWNTFVLDLSFVGWHILSAFTLGILGVLYVAPYQAQTNAALYESLRYGSSAPEAAPRSSQPATAPTNSAPVNPTATVNPAATVQPPVVPFAAVVEPAPTAQSEVPASKDEDPAVPAAKND